MSHFVSVPVLIPADIGFYPPPDADFFGPDGKINKEMLEWLQQLAHDFAFIEEREAFFGDTPCNLYFVFVRAQMLDGKAMMAPSAQYDDPVIHQEICETKWPDSTDNPLVLIFSAAMKGLIDGPPIFLSDFRDDGSGAKRKLLESVSNMVRRAVYSPTSEELAG